MNLDPIRWIREQCNSYEFNLSGIVRPNSNPSSWPVVAQGPAELEAALIEGGHLVALPKEPAALANVIEVSLVDMLLAQLDALDGAIYARGKERSYPDLEIGGAAFGNEFHAVDVKVARRNTSRKSTQSAITLYTGNTYFKWPDLHWSGTYRPFNEYSCHIDILVIYTLNPQKLGRVDDVELIIHEPWRIASRQRSSATREYIGAVKDLDRLRQGKGEFSSKEEFYKYWRKYPFKISTQVQKELEKLLELQTQEIHRLKNAPGFTEQTRGLN